MILRKTKFGLCRNHHTTYFCLYSLRLFHVYSVIISALYLQKCKKSFKIRFVLYTGCEKAGSVGAQSFYLIYLQLILAYLSDTAKATEALTERHWHQIWRKHPEEGSGKRHGHCHRWAEASGLRKDQPVFGCSPAAGGRLP
ncbi:hypothetical protein GCWU000341_00169 [Oribacterium sp. oral taxon 078 str. F0262]|nr:hypothetical protein GCWU000341_00169 [Oribacterium sp. oral taxon 078 str. F0262]